MKITESSNPIFNRDSINEQAHSYAGGETMTVSGTVNKTILLGLLVFAGAYYTYTNENTTLLYVGLIGGLIAALITTFKPKLAGTTAPIYAVLEGLFLGGISAQFSYLYDGIVFQAATLTIGVFVHDVVFVPIRNNQGY